MKKITSLLLLAVAFSFGACKKSGCWRCTTSYTGSAHWWIPKKGSAAMVKYCDKTEAEIRQIEKDGTGIQTMVQGDKAYEAEMKTTCK
jgi:hypothetical protein